MIKKRGSAAVLLAMTFVFLMLAVIASIGVSRRLVVKSECTVFGEVWAKAILSEYDRHLLEDYGVMAFQGPDSEVDRKLNAYVGYSISGKLDASISKANSNLMGYEMNDPENFKEAIKRSFVGELADSVVKGSSRTNRGEDERRSDRVIGNRVVINTLPSRGIGNTLDVKSLSESLKSEKLSELSCDKLGGTAVEVNFIRKHFGNNMTKATDKPSYFINEWEYIVNGKPDDGKNFRACRRKIFLVRNILNLFYLSTDAEKRALIFSAAELISPGPGGLVIQALIAEAWAAAESEYDVKTLVSGGRVPLMKTSNTWHTDLDFVLSGDQLKGGLSDEEKDALGKHRKEISDADGAKGVIATVKEGPSYEDYILLFIAATNENVRLLRTMDIVQINMKYRYYEDFNLEEYYRGIRFNINANGKIYEFEEEYQ